MCPLGSADCIWSPSSSYLRWVDVENACHFTIKLLYNNIQGAVERYSRFDGLSVVQWSKLEGRSGNFCSVFLLLSSVAVSTLSLHWGCQRHKIERRFTIDWISNTGGSGCHSTLPHLILCCHILSFSTLWATCVVAGLWQFGNFRVVCKGVNIWVWMPQVTVLEMC